MNAKLVAIKCVKRLFVNGMGSHAERLVLMSKDGKDLGGWCLNSVQETIREEIIKSMAADVKRELRRIA